MNLDRMTISLEDFVKTFLKKWKMTIIIVVLFATFQIIFGVNLCGNIRKGFEAASNIANEIAKGNVDNMTPEEVYKILESIPNFVTSNRDDVKVLKEFM